LSKTKEIEVLTRDFIKRRALKKKCLGQQGPPLAGFASL